VRFLVDQDVWAHPLRVPRAWGHDVVSASDVGQAQAEDTVLLKESHERDRILVARDRNFGRLVFAEERAAGILFLRVTPLVLKAVHEELARVLDEHTHAE